MGDNVFSKWSKATAKFRKGLADSAKSKKNNGMTLEQRRAEADKKPPPKLQSDGVYR